MPIYEFECSKCGKILEEIMKISDPAPTTCECGSEGPLVKIVSPTSFVLKGSGWYETDFKGSKKKTADAPSSESSTSSSKSEPVAGESKTSTEPPKKTAPKSSEK